MKRRGKERNKTCLCQRTSLKDGFLTIYPKESPSYRPYVQIVTDKVHLDLESLNGYQNAAVAIPAAERRICSDVLQWADCRPGKRPQRKFIPIYLNLN